MKHGAKVAKMTQEKCLAIKIIQFVALVFLHGK